MRRPVRRRLERRSHTLRASSAAPWSKRVRPAVVPGQHAARTEACSTDARSVEAEEQRAEELAKRGEEWSKCELRLVCLCSPGVERVLAVAMPWLGRQLRPRRWRGDGRSESLWPASARCERGRVAFQ